jgi:hypothetical protein
LEFLILPRQPLNEILIFPPEKSSKFPTIYNTILGFSIF